MQRTKETGISGELKTSNIRVVDAAETPRPSGHAEHAQQPAARAVRRRDPGHRPGVLLRVPRQPDQESRRSEAAPRAAVPRHGAGALRQGRREPAHQQRRARQLLGKLPRRAHQPAVLVGGRRRPQPRRHEHRTGRRQDARRHEPGRRRWRRPGSGCCSSTPTCASRACTPSSRSRSNRGCRTSSSATPRFSEAVHTTTVPGLWMVPAGAAPAQPGRAARLEAVHGLRWPRSAEHFDWVIVDTPPVMAVTDSSVVAHLATGVLFVVGAEMTSRYAAQRAVEQLDRSSREVRRRSAQPRRPAAQRVLLLAVLPPRVQRLLPEHVITPLESAFRFGAAPVLGSSSLVRGPSFVLGPDGIPEPGTMWTMDQELTRNQGPRPRDLRLRRSESALAQAQEEPQWRS